MGLSKETFDAMKPSARMWLEERRRQMNELPLEEEERLRRMKLRLGITKFVKTECEELIPAPSVDHCVGRNATLSSRVSELEAQCRRSDEQQQLQRGRLLEALDENRRCAMQLVFLTHERRWTELVQEEELYRERVLRMECAARGDMTLVMHQRKHSMSSHSSDVCVIEGTEDSSAAAPALQSDGLVRTPSTSTLFSESCEAPAAPVPPVSLSEMGTTTEFPIDESVSALLERGIMDLLQAVAGDAFAQHTCDESRRGFALSSAAAASKAARTVSDGLRRLTARPPLAAQQSAPPAARAEPPPVWLAQLHASLASADALVREVLAHSPPLHIRTPTDSAAPPPRTETAQRASPVPACTNPLEPVPVAGSCCECAGRVAELEAELRELRRSAAETRAVLSREGAASVLPLYDELLKLRASRRLSASRDLDATAAALAAQEKAFAQCLRAAERRRQALSAESLREDVALLEEMRVALEGLRRSAPRAADLSAVSGEKRTRSENDAVRDTERGEGDGKGGAVDALLAREGALRGDISRLRGELAAERSASAQWRERYDAALRDMQRPQESPAIRALLREVEEHMGAAAARREAQLCRLFGWELLELSERTVELARAGASAGESPLTLPLPSATGDSSAAVAASIVLAKKVIEGCAARQKAWKQQQEQEQAQQQRQQQVQRTMEENEEEEEEAEVNTVQSLKDDEAVPQPMHSGCAEDAVPDTANEASEAPASPNVVNEEDESSAHEGDVMGRVGEGDLENTGEEEKEEEEQEGVENTESKKEEPKEESKSPATNENSAEPFFYDDGGLWEE